MKRFTIGDTEFGIDVATSSFDVDVSDAESPTITIEIAGDLSTFDLLTVDDDSEWSWALHPPAFCLRGYPLRIEPSSDTVSAHVMRDDLDKYEFSIYMMEHNLIEEMDVEVIPNKYLAISGRVDMFGEIHDFRIEWKREEAK